MCSGLGVLLPRCDGAGGESIGWGIKGVVEVVGCGEGHRAKLWCDEDEVSS